MYTAPRAKEIAEQNRTVNMVFFYLDKQVTEELILGKRCTSFTHEGLKDPVVKKEIIRRLEHLEYQVYGCDTIISIYWDQ